MARSRDADRFDAVFCDTCIGGSTVAARLARPGAGLRAMFLADYAVNPLGTKSDADVRAALDRWVDAAAGSTDNLVVACNTASVRLEDALGVRRRAEELGVRVHSMVDLLDVLLTRQSADLDGKRVCIMGTAYTVGRPVYADRLRAAGVDNLSLLAATQTERIIAHLQHQSAAALETINEEIGETLADADAVLLACTCFPLISELIEAIRPGILQLDPGREVGAVLPASDRHGPNHLTLAFTGDAVTRRQLEDNAAHLFPGWDRIEVVRTAI